MTDTKPVTKPVLTGPINGNIFAILGEARRLLRHNKQDPAEMVHKVMQAHSYDDALTAIMEYVEIDLDN
jgi:hypothetical protein